MSKRMPKQKPGESEQSVGTPRDFLDAVEKRLGIDGFEWDLAASEDNTIVPIHYYYDPDTQTDVAVKNHFDETDNALVQEWSIYGWNWLNPPFGDINPWVKKAWEESRRGVHTAVLVPASVGSKWWAAWVDNKAYVTYLTGRLTFVGHTKPYPKDCALLLYAPFLAGGSCYWNWKQP